MLHNDPPYTHICRIPYDNSLPTYEEATGIIPQRTNNEIVLDVPVFSTHQSSVTNHYQATTPPYESNTSLINENQEGIFLETTDEYGYSRKITSMLVCIVLAVFVGGFFIFAILHYIKSH